MHGECDAGNKTEMAWCKNEIEEEELERGNKETWKRLRGRGREREEERKERRAENEGKKFPV